MRSSPGRSTWTGRRARNSTSSARCFRWRRRQASCRGRSRTCACAGARSSSSCSGTSTTAPTAVAGYRRSSAKNPDARPSGKAGAAVGARIRPRRPRGRVRREPRAGGASARPRPRHARQARAHGARRGHLPPSTGRRPRRPGTVAGQAGHHDDVPPARGAEGAVHLWRGHAGSCGSSSEHQGAEGRSRDGRSPAAGERGRAIREALRGEPAGVRLTADGRLSACAARVHSCRGSARPHPRSGRGSA